MKKKSKMQLMKEDLSLKGLSLLFCWAKFYSTLLFVCFGITTIAIHLKDKTIGNKQLRDNN